MQWQIEKIINVANELASTGTTGASTGEIIAAAFAINRLEFLPPGYTAVEAWDRLDAEWQGYARQVQREYRHQLVPW